MKRSPEFELLLATAVATPGAESYARIEKITANGIDWVTFVAMASFHGVRPTVYRSLRNSVWDVVPSEIQAEMDAAYLANSGRARFLTGELLRILEVFDRHAIEVVPFKGPLLAESAYGDVAFREFVDLDLLVRYSDIEAARGVLQELGYVSGMSPAPIPIDTNADEMSSPTTGILVELHWEFAPARFIPALRAEHVWRNVSRRRLFGRDILCMSAEDTFLFLCFHGGKHCWSSLKWICDVHEGLQSEPQPDLHRVELMARERGMRRQLDLGLALSRQLLQSEGGVESATDGRVGRLRDEIVEALCQCREPGAREGQIVALRLKDSRLDWLRYIWAQLTHYSGEELQFVSLPPSLSFLYRVVRPLWLLREYGLR